MKIHYFQRYHEKENVASLSDVTTNGSQVVPPKSLSNKSVTISPGMSSTKLSFNTTKSCGLFF